MNASYPSVMSGLFFGFLNLWLLSRIIRGFVQAEEIKKGKMAAYFIVKMTLIFVTIGLILKKGYVTPLPFLTGFTASLFLGIIILLVKAPKIVSSVDSIEASPTSKEI